MLQSSDVIAFVPVTDLNRGRDFYTRILGLPVIEQNPYACVFNANGTMLRLTAVTTVATPGYTVLGWKVTDLQSTVRALAARGVTFSRYDGMEQDEHGIWAAPTGDKIAWFQDPDGNVLSLTQFRVPSL
ncbi:MAG: VOC family protein [Streptosporangiaceae bacterium]|nr:VOC family protein [Streptosporangiaceae bacterium]